MQVGRMTSGLRGKNVYCRGAATGLVGRVLLKCILLLLFTLISPALAEDINVLVIGSTRDSADVINRSNQSQPFNPTSIRTELQNILSQDPGIASANVVFEDYYENSSSSSMHYCCNLYSWYYWPYTSGGQETRKSNLRGEEGTDWDYVVLIGDPWTMEEFPGLYAHGVALIAEQVTQGGAETILLMPWPGDNSGPGVDHYKEVVYRAGRSGGHKVAPAGLAWQDAGAVHGSKHPTNDGAYIAAASIYSRIWGQSAAVSGYEYNDDLAATVHTTVTANIGIQQYSGKFSHESPFLRFNDQGRKVNVQKTHNSSTESRFAGAAGLAIGRAGLYREKKAGKADTVFMEGRSGMVVGVPVDLPTFTFTMYWSTDIDAAKARLCYLSTDLAADIKESSHYSTYKRVLPWDICWAGINDIHPEIRAIGDDNAHLGQTSDPQKIGPGTYMYTQISARCPVDPRPDNITPEWTAQMVGYQTAWHIGNCQTRAPGFKVMGSANEALTLRCGYTETMTVRFMLPPREDVTVGVSIAGSSVVTVSPATLTFTPENYDVPQQVTVTAHAGQSVEEAFQVVYNTASQDEVYNELGDSWEYTYLPNQAPVAEDQTTYAVVDKQETITLGATDPDGHALTYTVTAAPTKGSLDTTNRQVVVYTPNAGNTEADQLTFQVTDGYGGTSEAIVTIVMVASNNEPNVEAGENQTVVLGSGDYPWTPADADPADIALWADASDTDSIVADSSGYVSQWKDKSGNGRHLTMDNADKMPLTGVRTMPNSGLNVLDFDGVDYMQSDHYMPDNELNNLAVLAVVDVDVIDDRRDAIFGFQATESTTDKLHLRASSSGEFKPMIYSDSLGKEFPFSGGPYHDASIFGISLAYVHDAPEQLHIFVKGYVDGHTKVEANFYDYAVFEQMDYFRVMSRDGNPKPVDGCMGEVIVLENTSAELRQKMEGYLAHKWGLEGKLPADHPYKAVPPMNTAAAAHLDTASADDGGDGMALTTTWTVVSAPEGSTAFFDDASEVNTTARFSHIGTYVLQLEADDVIDQVVDTVTITVTDNLANTAPVIDSAPWADTDPVALPNTTNVNVVASDADGDTLSYTWSKVSGPGTVTFTPNGTAASNVSEVSFSLDGTYTLRVTVSDGTTSVTGDLTIVVNAALALDHFDFSTIGTPQTVGVPFSVTITAILTDGNPDTSYNGSVILSGLAADGTTPVAVTPTSVTLVNGTATVDVTVNEAATDMTLEASD